jgi:hypothetical protein
MRESALARGMVCKPNALYSFCENDCILKGDRQEGEVSCQRCCTFEKSPQICEVAFTGLTPGTLFVFSTMFFVCCVAIWALADESDVPSATVTIEETPFAEVQSVGPSSGCYATATAEPMDLPPSCHAIALADGDDAMQYYQGRQYPTATPFTRAEPKSDYDARSL